MDHALEQEQENYRSRLYHFRGMQNTGRHVKSLSADNVNEPVDNDKSPTRIQGSKHVNEHSSDKQQVSWSLHRTNDKASKPRTPKDGAKDNQPSDLDLMKERFAKLLLGEDMSGGGKGVSSALALSNAFTNLAAAVFGEQKRLEPMGPERKARWRKEIDWLLSVTDHIVELVPTKQKTNGISMEIMVTKQRTDLQMNIPALRKLDAMLIDCLDNFKDQNEFYYVSKDEEAKEKGRTKRKDDKWWLPTPKVPPNGLSEMSKKWLQYQKDCVNQVLKAAMAINAQVLLEMEIPESYIESLPKNGRASLGESIYKGITDEFFDPEQFLSTMDMSSEHKILDLKNRIEASIVIWKRKMTNKDSKSSWPSSVSLEKREVFEERAETILLLLKQRFPGLPQSSLDISKIQCNRDVGHAILESYSRVLESLAFTVLSRIDDVLYADYCATHPSQRSAKRNPLKDSSFTMRTTKAPSPQEEAERLSTCGTPTSGTLLDFMGWGLDQGDEKKEEAGDEFFKDGDPKYMNKVSNVTPTKKKVSYIDRLDNWGGSRSP